MNVKKYRLLVLGATGMLGSAIYRYFQNEAGYMVAGTVRTQSKAGEIFASAPSGLLFNVNTEDLDNLVEIFNTFSPDLVINCIGIVKQAEQAENPLTAIPINSLFPHRVASLCKLTRARFIHISTDCVFSGSKGNYVEADVPDARDLYGLTKYLGEVTSGNAITLRTSIIGHELSSAQSLIEWFLRQNGFILGYRRAIFSGVPTVELARIIRDYVIPNPDLNGLYHVSAAPISKYDLLKLVASEYRKEIEIRSDDHIKIDRSLDSSRFQLKTGYAPVPWPELIRQMHAFR